MLTKEEQKLFIEAVKYRDKIRLTDLLEVGVTMCIDGIVYIGIGQGKVTPGSY